MQVVVRARQKRTLLNGLRGQAGPSVMASTALAFLRRRVVSLYSRGVDRLACDRADQVGDLLIASASSTMLLDLIADHADERRHRESLISKAKRSPLGALRGDCLIQSELFIH